MSAEVLEMQGGAVPTRRALIQDLRTFAYNNPAFKNNHVRSISVSVQEVEPIGDPALDESGLTTEYTFTATRYPAFDPDDHSETVFELGVQVGHSGTNIPKGVLETLYADEPELVEAGQIGTCVLDATVYISTTNPQVRVCRSVNFLDEDGEQLFYGCSCDSPLDEEANAPEIPLIPDTVGQITDLWSLGEQIDSGEALPDALQLASVIFASLKRKLRQQLGQ